MTRWSAWVVAVLASVAIGCAAKKPKSAAEYFASASEHFRNGAFGAATSEYRELLDQHPFSDFVEEAELRIAHAQYLDGRYPEAVVALTDFQRRHPTSPHLPFIGYLLGMCYARQMLDYDRDQTAAQNAQTYFLTVVRQYPESPYAELARSELKRCRQRLAAHELYIAEFYSRRGNWKAAETRIVELAARYGDTEEAARGLLQLARYYRSRGLVDRAALAYRAVTELRPGTPQAVAAQRALQRLQDQSSTFATQANAVDVLLALNGRSRVSDMFETAQVPPPQPAQLPSRASGFPAPALGTGFDPFGRGRTYY
ncbi:MAG: outer membrane protein assembly factor BamD [Candidatus Binatia bacterium]|nr:outer membrane protein assembly factor BamD [Candidatus Binatia bacterium]